MRKLSLFAIWSVVLSAAIAAWHLTCWPVGPSGNNGFGPLPSLDSVLAARQLRDPGHVPEPALIRAGLLQEPLSPTLLTALAMAAERDGDRQRLTRLMRVAGDVSRREPISQIWLIGDAVTQGQISTAIEHYHAVLTVHPQLGDSLIPALAAATVEPAVRGALAPYIREGTSWSAPLVSRVAAEAPLAEVLDLLGPVGTGMSREAYRGANAAILLRLAAERSPEAAATFAARTIPGLAARDLSTIAPSPKTVDPRLGSFAWTFPGAENVRVDLSDGVLVVTAAPLVRAPIVLRDILVPPAGTLRIGQQTFGDKDLGGARLVWSATCPAAGDAAANPSPPFFEATLVPQTVLTIKAPPDCPVIRLSLHLNGPDGQFPATFRLKLT